MNAKRKMHAGTGVIKWIRTYPLQGMNASGHFIKGLAERMAKDVEMREKKYVRDEYAGGVNEQTYNRLEKWRKAHVAKKKKRCLGCSRLIPNNRDVWFCRVCRRRRAANRYGAAVERRQKIKVE